MRQTNIYDFIEDKDWIDQTYYAYYCKGSEYSPKFRTEDQAATWMEMKGCHLADRFKRELVLTERRPSDSSNAWDFVWEQTIGSGMIQVCYKRVPGEDFDDAKAHLELFVPEAVNITYHIEES